MRHLRQVVLSIFALTVASSVASAQRPAPRRNPQPQQRSVWELGADAGLSFGLDDPKVTTLDTPARGLRAGYFLSDEWSLEPFFGLTMIKPQNVGAVTFWHLGVGGLYHFSTSRVLRQFYLRPFVTMVAASGPGPDNSDVGVGIGGGVKWPRLGGRLALRGEVNFSTVNVSTVTNNSALSALFGLSFYTH